MKYSRSMFGINISSTFQSGLLYQLLRTKGIQALDICVVNPCFILSISSTVMQLCIWTSQTFFPTC